MTVACTMKKITHCLIFVSWDFNVYVLIKIVFDLYILKKFTASVCPSKPISTELTQIAWRCWRNWSWGGHKTNQFVLHMDWELEFWRMEEARRGRMWRTTLECFAMCCCILDMNGRLSGPFKKIFAGGQELSEVHRGGCARAKLSFFQLR